MSVNTKFIIATLALFLATFIWYCVIVQIFVSVGPGNGEINSNVVPYVIMAVVAFIVANLILETMYIFAWFAKKITGYALILLVALSIANLALVIIGLKRYI